MIDLGFDKLALIGTVALIVIGPEKLPRVARTVGTFVGKARRYVADVKAEVNRTIELEELQKVKSQFETAARDVEQSIQQGVHSAQASLDDAFSPEAGATDSVSSPPTLSGAQPFMPWEFRPTRKNWRLKRGALPRWFKQREGVRGHVQSGAARVARHRPPGLKKG